MPSHGEAGAKGSHGRACLAAGQPLGAYEHKGVPIPDNLHILRCAQLLQGLVHRLHRATSVSGHQNDLRQMWRHDGSSHVDRSTVQTVIQVGQVHAAMYLPHGPSLGNCRVGDRNQHHSPCHVKQFGALPVTCTTRLPPPLTGAIIAPRVAMFGVLRGEGAVMLSYNSTYTCSISNSPCTPRAPCTLDTP